MDYMIVFKETQHDFDARSDPARSPQYWAAWMAYVGALNESGAVVSGAALQPPHTATQLRLREGQRQVQDGPYADTLEHLAGFFILRLETLDDALAWAARAPCAETGSVEVRPVLPMQPRAEA